MYEAESYRLLEESLRAIGLDLRPEQGRQLLQYVHLIIEGMNRQRLVGTRDEKELIGKHICDSLFPLKFNIISSGEMLDLGTGAGLPGIPLKICLPEQVLILMDSSRRKISFLKRVCAEIALNKTYFLHGRAEDWARHKQHRERYDIVVSRGVADTAILAELALPLTRTGGNVLLYKGQRGQDEANAASEALRLCGGEIENIYCYRLPTGENRTLLYLKKIRHTPALYPRRPGKPAKKPLQ